MIKNMPIGIFDSGVGGLTVVKEVQRIMPNENIIYLGDTERLPYGSKTESTIRKISRENSVFLKSKGVKIIVVACNTASSVSADMLRSEFDLPIVGVVESGARKAVNVTKKGAVGVIGTKTTIRTGAYSKAIKRIDPNIDVYELSTPLLVHLVEENWVEKKVTQTILNEYLSPLLDVGIDTLVLGCTHYPFLEHRIKELVPNIHIVNSTAETALLIEQLLISNDIRSSNNTTTTTSIYFSDMHTDFTEWTKEYLGEHISINKVDLKYNGMEYSE